MTKKTPQKTKSRNDIASILWASHAPVGSSGYGRVTASVVTRLIDAGVNVMCLSIDAAGNPHYVKMPQWKSPITLIPLPHEFDGALSNFYRVNMSKYGMDILITHWDSWAFDHNLGDMIPTWIAYAPLDAEPVGKINHKVHKKAYRLVNFSRFAYEEYKKVGIDSSLIYHGVDTKLYRPLPPEEKAAAKFSAGFPRDAFVFGTVGVNVMDRKNFPSMIEIFSTFVKKHKIENAYLYIHAREFKNDRPQSSFDIAQLSELYDITDRIRLPVRIGIEEEKMVSVYNMMDVYLSTSKGEGFGLPILEAQSCGIPVIAADNSAQHELVAGHGWLIDCPTHEISLITPCHNRMRLVSIDDGIRCLEEAYDDAEARAKYAQASREFAMGFDWDIIVEKGWIPFLEEYATADAISRRLKLWNWR